MAKILVTCVGSGVGQSTIDSLNMLREDYIIGCDMNRNIYATHFCDEVQLVPSMFSDDYLDFLLSLAMEKKVDIIIPGHDHELLILSKNIERFHQEGIEVLVSEPTIVELSRDKYLWYKYFKERGCSIVPTYKVGEFMKNPDMNIFPAIIKPAGGSASQGISIILDITEIEPANEEDIIQPYLFPLKSDSNFNTILKAVNNRKFVQMSEISIQLIFGKDAKFKALFISKNVLKSGVPVFVDPIQPDKFPYLDEIMKFVPICEEKGVMGPVNIQGRITETGLIFFEMNMRFTGITGNRAQLGFNEVKFLVNNFLNIEDSLLGYCDNKLGVRQVACTTIPRLKTELINKNYTILGAGGFIGKKFLNNLLEKDGDNRINIICRYSSYDKYKSFFQSDKIKIYKDDDQHVQTIYCQTDVLINFTGALAYHNDSDKYDSILFQYDQIKKIAKAHIPLIINISSQSVYSQTENYLKTEQSKVLIDNAYAFQKYVGEKMFDTISDDFPYSRCISLRFPRVLGKGDLKKNGFFQNVVEAVYRDEKIGIPFPMNNTSLLDIEDALSAIDYIIDSDIDFPRLMNVNGVNVTMKEYAIAVLNFFNKKDKIQLIDFGNSSDIQNSSQIDDTLFRSYGWKNKYHLEDIIAHIFESIA